MTTSMKTVLALCSIFLTAISARADVTINLGAGQLSLSNGDPIPAGSLLQLVVSTGDNVFTPPVAGDFATGDDIVVASFSSNEFLGGPGGTANSIIFTLTSGVSAGDQLLLRWWPTLTTSSISPSTGDMFGQFRTDAVENSSDIGWFVPADGSTVALNFLTSTFDGTEPDLVGDADFFVAPIPEPSTYALIIAGGIGFLALRRRAKL